MPDYLVTCINKPNRDSIHEHITHIGNAQAKWTREDAIRRIDAKTDTFHTIDKATGAKVYVGVFREQGKAPYLRTYADGKWTNNLVNLPTF